MKVELLTYSSMAAFKSCKRAYYYRFVLGLTPRLKRESLRLGSLVHLGLEKGREDALASLEGVYPSSQEESNELETMRITANAMLQGYEEALDPLDLVDKELKFELTIKNPATRRMSPKFRLSGKADGLAKKDNGYWLVEYKTAGQIDKSYMDRLSLDAQVTTYIYGLQRQLGINLNGVIYRILRKPTIRQRKDESLYEYQDRLVKDYLERPEWYFHEEILYRSQEDLEEFERELWQVAQDLKDTLKTGRWYKNTSRCADYGLCQYAPLCLKQGGAELLFEIAEPHEELK